MDSKIPKLLRPRWSAAIVLLILATAGLVATVASRWTHDVLFDTETWVETVSPIGTDEVVTDALSEIVATELIAWIDAENRMGSLVPPALAPLAGLMAPWVNDLILEETEDFFDSELYGSAWTTINERGHAAAVAIIRDQLPLVSTAGGVVTVDLEPLLAPVADRVFARLTELGGAIPGALLDQVDIDETIARIIETYEQEGIPDRLRNVEVYDSERLAAVQQTTALLDLLVWVLPVLTLLLAGGALYFAPHRGLMSVYLLGAAALGWLLAWLAVRLVGNAIVSSIDSTTTADVADAVFTGVTNGLTTILVVLALVAGVGSVLVGWWLYREEGVGDDEASPPIA